MDDRRPTKRSITTHADANPNHINNSLAITDEPILQCAHFILPFLNPQELASVASTCKTLNSIVTVITTARSSDASRGFENQQIPFHNIVDHQPYSYFLYSASNLYRSNPIRRQAWGLFDLDSSGRGRGRGISDLNRIGEELDVSFEYGEGIGCDCEKCGGECPCDVLGFEEDVVGVRSECGRGCDCGIDCCKRTSQRGILVKLRIVKDGRKGWGLCASEFIQCGQFVCEYAGELLTTNEARKRQNIYDQRSKNGSSSALLVVREHLPSGKACLRINIDATQIGNVGRFINHSCDGGNLSTIIVRSSGALLPRLCFFAATDIQEGDELTFSYGSTSLRSNGLPCFCGSSCCSGVLPSEAT